MALATATLFLLVLPLDRLAAIPGLNTLAGMHMPWVVFAAGVLANVAGSWLLVAAAAMLRGALRWLAGGLFAAFWVPAVPMDAFALIPMAAALGYLAWTQVVRVPTRLSLAVAFVPAVGAYALSFRLGSLWLALTLLNQLTVFYLLFIPAIFLSGFDLGETAVHITRLGLRVLYGRVPSDILWWFALVLTVSFGLLALRDFHSLRASLIGWIPALTVIGVGAAVTARLHPEDAEPPEILPLLLSMVVMATVGGLREWHAVASWLAVSSMLAGGALWLLTRGRRYAEVIVFLTLFGLFNLVSRMVFGASGLLWSLWPHFPAVGLSNLTLAVVLAVVGDLLWLRLTRRLTPATVLLPIFAVIGLMLITGVWTLLAGLQSWAGATLSGEALLLIVGLAHDVWASGGMLNRESRHAPRSGRILLYVGYIILLCGATVLANGTAGPTRSLIRIDTLQQAGLFVIGIPLFLEQFLHWFQADNAPATTGTPMAKSPSTLTPPP